MRTRNEFANPLRPADVCDHRAVSPALGALGHDNAPNWLARTPLASVICISSHISDSDVVAGYATGTTWLSISTHVGTCARSCG